MMNEIALKYGCNPNQTPARVYADGGLPFTVLNGRPGYINLLAPEKGKVSFSMLDGKVDDPNYQYISLALKEEVPAINELIACDLCPKGYQHRETNPVIFATLEISGLRAEGYRSKKDGTAKAALKGVLSGVRYLKADGNIFVGGQKNTGAAQAA